MNESDGQRGLAEPFRVKDGQPEGLLLGSTEATWLRARWLATGTLKVLPTPGGGGLPRFVEREFREFLTCGALGRGFARVRCENCAFERVFSVSFSWSAGLCGRLMRQGCPKVPSSTRAVSGQGVGTCDLSGQHTQRDPRQGEEEDDPDGRRVAHRRVARYSCFLRVRSQHMEPTPGGDGSKGEVRCAPSPGIFYFLPVCPPRPSSPPAS